MIHWKFYPVGLSHVLHAPWVFILYDISRSSFCPLFLRFYFIHKKYNLRDGDFSGKLQTLRLLLSKTIACFSALYELITFDFYNRQKINFLMQNKLLFRVEQMWRKQNGRVYIDFYLILYCCCFSVRPFVLDFSREYDYFHIGILSLPFTSTILNKA